MVLDWVGRTLYVCTSGSGKYYANSLSSNEVLKRRVEWIMLGVLPMYQPIFDLQWVFSFCANWVEVSMNVLSYLQIHQEEIHLINFLFFSKAIEGNDPTINCWSIAINSRLWRWIIALSMAFHQAFSGRGGNETEMMWQTKK